MKPHGYFVAEKTGGVAKIVRLNLSRGITPRLPGYRFSKRFETEAEAKAYLKSQNERNKEISITTR